MLQRLRRLWRREPRAKPREVYLSLRSRVLDLDPDELRVPDERHIGPAWCALMEVGLADATASIVAVADGTVSFYTSAGGGTIGAGEHAAAREAGMRFLEVAGNELRSLQPTGDFPLPDAGQVRFHVRASAGNLTGEAPENALQRGRHVLSPLYFAGQDVLTEIRLLSEEGRGR
jgi:hypothetical protein